jgi:hypothetical protein
MKARVWIVMLVCVLLAGDKPRLSRTETDDNVSIPMDAIKVPPPDVQQPNSYTCGVGALMSIASYYGVGPEDFDEFQRDLGTTTSFGTSVYRMEKFARKLGLNTVLFRDGASDGTFQNGRQQAES